MVKRVADPKVPSQQEVEKHCLRGHSPCRNRCPISVEAKGMDSDHRKDWGKERKMPECQYDHCFPGDEFGFKWIVLVGKDTSKALMATAVPNTPASGKSATDECSEHMEKNGDGDSNVIVKTDQEPAISICQGSCGSERGGKDHPRGICCTK